MQPAPLPGFVEREADLSQHNTLALPGSAALYAYITASAQPGGYVPSPSAVDPRGAGLPPRPAEVAGRGSAQVWTLAPAGSRSAPVAVISGRDAASIGALERGLPHYGAQSWLVFEGGRAIARGTWPASLPAVPVVRR